MPHAQLPLIYLDNNATTKPAPEVITAMVQGLETKWANPSSIHGLGQETARALTQARTQIAQLLGIETERIVFTSGATEANEAIMRYYANRGAMLITSAAEHPAITGYYLKYKPQHVYFVPLDKEGRWHIEDLEKTLNKITGQKLIAFALAHGETGVLQDLNALQTLALQYRANFLVDASQAVGRIDVNPPPTGYFSFSGHKLHGPKGIGVLVYPENTHGITIAVGGKQEEGRRGGTENVPGIIGLGIACDLRYRFLTHTHTYLQHLRDLFEKLILDSLSDKVSVNSINASRIPNTSHLTFHGIDGMALVARLEERNIFCSQVSACSSGSPEPSPTLLAMGRSHEDAFSSVRFALSINNTRTDIETAARVIVEEVKYLRTIISL
ncbi:MAG: cysteine desulfurase [Acetobacter sp.]|nr:cysteine desulfurase [Acetobacter sp.]